jgi:putative ABC transport system ATP-binding protein
VKPISETPVIFLRDLKKRFGIGDAEKYALKGVNLTVNNGEFIAIMGPSGCGKTTLLNILGLLDNSIDGEYKLNNEPVGSISKRKQARIRSQQIGFIFQNFNLVARLNVVENVALPLSYKGIGHTKRLTMASEILRNFHLNEREYYMPYQLSGGQTQRIAIARALVNEPSIILADEPTGNLDSHATHVIMQELSDLHKRGKTIIMVTHNPDLTTYASRVITMLDGQIDTDSNPTPTPLTERELVPAVELNYSKDTEKRNLTPKKLKPRQKRRLQKANSNKKNKKKRK